MLKAGRRTKPRPHKRERMRGGISRNLPWRCRKAPCGPGCLAEPAKAAGIAPRLEPAGRRGRAQAPAAARTGFEDEASALETRSGRAARPSGGAAIRRVFRGVSASRNSSNGGTASAQRLSKGRPERLRPRCEPWRRRGFRSCRIRQGSEGEDFGPSTRPDGDRRGALCSFAETHWVPNGASQPRSGIRGKAKAGVRARLAIQSRPARDGLATQRRQSKLGQVGAGGDTGPHSDSGA
jgi:hypothetical protein